VGELQPGIYEVLVTEALRSQLEILEGESSATRPLRPAEAADRIALHLSRQIEQSLEGVGDVDRVRVGIEVARALIDRLSQLVATDPASAPVQTGEVLHAILGRRPDGNPEHVSEPLIPLLDTTLLTNAPGEPRLLSIGSAVAASADGRKPVSGSIPSAFLPDFGHGSGPYRAK
jgi:hypothetical protein